MLNPSVNYVGTKARVKFRGDCLKQEKISFDYRKIVDIYIVYEINKTFNSSSYPTLENCLYGVVKLAKHTNFDLYKYSGYCVELDRKGFFSINDEIGKNAIIFGVDIKKIIKMKIIKKYILSLGKSPTQRLEDTPAAEKLYSINFTKENTKFA